MNAERSPLQTAKVFYLDPRGPESLQGNHTSHHKATKAYGLIAIPSATSGIVAAILINGSISHRAYMQYGIPIKNCGKTRSKDDINRTTIINVERCRNYKFSVHEKIRACGVTILGMQASF